MFLPVPRKAAMLPNVITSDIGSAISIILLVRL